MWNENNVKKMTINPFYCITIAEGLYGKHPPLVSKEVWIKSNVQMIKEMGAEEWLKMLLDVLSGGYVASSDNQKRVKTSH